MGEYYTRITLGAQPVRVQVDTGSSTLALPLAECEKCLPSDQRYNPKVSKTGKARVVSCMNEACTRDMCSVHKCSKCSAHDACCADENPAACGFMLAYGDQSFARGALMVDTMGWGNVSASVVFGGILLDSTGFERSMVDGIMGMAYKSLACNPTCVEPPFQQLVKAGVVEDSFSICITGQGGKLVLGAFEKSLAAGEMKYVPMALSDPPTFYTVNVTNYMTVGGRRVGVPNLRAGIVDSGTTLVVVSQATFVVLLKHIIQFNCDIPGLCNTDRPWFMPAACVKLPEEYLAKMPNITFHVTGDGTTLDLELRPDDYMLKMTGEKREYRCVGIMAMKQMQEGTDIIFGNTVMQRYVTHYDRKNKRMGFAPSAAGCGGAARCGSYTQCNECAAARGCSFNFRSASCTDGGGGGLIPYPECKGDRCLCGLGPQVSVVFGAIAGVVGSLLVAAVVVFVAVLYGRRERWTRVGAVEVETDTDEEGYGDGRGGKKYQSVPTEQE